MAFSYLKLNTHSLVFSGFEILSDVDISVNIYKQVCTTKRSKLIYLIINH